MSYIYNIVLVIMNISWSMRNGILLICSPIGQLSVLKYFGFRYYYLLFEYKTNQSQWQTQIRIIYAEAVGKFKLCSFFVCWWSQKWYIINCAQFHRAFRLAVAHEEMNPRKRNTMEDVHRIVDNLIKNDTELYSYFGVYDGNLSHL